MAQKMSISLEDRHVRIIERFGKKMGISAFSTALQALIHQFDQQQKTAEAADKPADASTSAPEPVAA